MERHRFDADPDPTLLVDADPDPDPIGLKKIPSTCGPTPSFTQVEK